MSKVSVIVPVYNVEPYLRKCLDSLVNQTLEKIEIICINDCSPDNSLDILKEYAEKDDRIKIIDFEKNQGVSMARNAGMEIAKGEYIGFCDPDDYVDLNFYEKLYEKARETGAEMVKSSLKKKKVDWIKEYPYFASIKKSKYCDVLYHCCYIYKVSILKKYRINYPVGVNFSEDTVFLVKSLFYSDKIEVVDDVFYHYILRNHGAATSYIGESIPNSYGTPLVFDFINKAIKDKNKYEDVFCNIFIEHLLAVFSRIIPQFRMGYTRIVADIYKNRKYPIVLKNIPKFLEENDFEYPDILLKKINDNIGLLQYPKIEVNNLQNRKFYIWGAGADALEALAQCDSNGWKIENFLDSNSQITEFQGYRVLHPQNLLNSESKDFFIVISSRNYAGEIAKICEQAGFKEGVDFWKSG